MTISHALDRLHALRDDLRSVLIERDDPIEAALVALIQPSPSGCCSARPVRPNPDWSSN